jgi:hypothetical protein
MPCTFVIFTPTRDSALLRALPAEAEIPLMEKRVTHLPVNPSTRPLPVDRNRPSASRHHPLEVLFRPCGFSPLRQFSPGRGCGLVPSHNRLLGPPRFQRAATRPTEIVRPAHAPFPATQTPFEVFPSSAAVPRHRGLLPSCHCLPLWRTCTRSRTEPQCSSCLELQNPFSVRDSFLRTPPTKRPWVETKSSIPKCSSDVLHTPTASRRCVPDRSDRPKADPQSRPRIPKAAFTRHCDPPKGIESLVCALSHTSKQTTSGVLPTTHFVMPCLLQPSRDRIPHSLSNKGEYEAKTT